MRIFPPAMEIGETEGFTAEKDILGRAPFGEGLANLLGNLTDPTVLAVDGQWGSGKTTFLKMWAGLLRQQGFPVIYFDAFENDYAEDAFTALAAEIIALIEASRKAAEPRAKAFMSKAFGASKILARSALKVGVKVGTMGALEASDLGALAEAVSSETEELTDKHIGELLTKQAERRNTLQAFRDALRDLPSILVPQVPSEDGKPDNTKPLIFIIDELDRCRPLFALELLERIKHFFTVPNVHFVLGTHMGQLRNSVRAAYGAEIDATTYLQKFIHILFPLTDYSRFKNDTSSSKYIRHLTKVLDLNSQDYNFWDSLTSFIETYAICKRASLRDVERIITNCALAAAFTGENNLRPPPLIAGLSILRLSNPDLYVRARQGTLRYEEAESALGLAWVGSGEDAGGYSDWEQGWWHYALDRDWDADKVTEYARGLYRFSLSDRFSIIPLIAHGVIDRLSPN